MLALPPGPHVTRTEMARRQVALDAATAAVAANAYFKAWAKVYESWMARLPDLSGLDETEAWSYFRDSHAGRCALCFQEHRRLVVDHDHRTGHVRGMLCGPCNQDAPSVVAHDPIQSWRSPQIARYCQYPPAAAMRLRLIYVDHVMHKDPAPDLLTYIWYPEPTGLERWHGNPFGRPAAVARGYEHVTATVLNMSAHRCGYCPRRFDAKRAASLHERRCPDNPSVNRAAWEAGKPLQRSFACQHCGHRVKTRRGMRRHLYYSHGYEVRELGRWLD